MEECQRKNKLYYFTPITLGIAFPLALIAHPSPISLPVDLLLGIVIPIHSQIGMHGVITDYIPRRSQNVALVIMYIITGLTLAGFLKINLQGGGITNGVKQIYRDPVPAKN